jgi:hypothetical protein
MKTLIIILLIAIFAIVGIYIYTVITKKPKVKNGNGKSGGSDEVKEDNNESHGRI